LIQECDPPHVLFPTSELVSLLSLAFSAAHGFGAPTVRSALKHVTRVRQSIEHGSYCSSVDEQFAQVLFGPTRRQNGLAERFAAFIGP
jgi:hypothetical protein